MKFKAILICLIISLFTHIQLYSNTNIIKETETLYNQQKYQLSLDKYKLLLKTNKENANLLFNIGNTYFKLNKMGYAIGYYLKALKLAPSNKDYIYNLTLARKFIQYENKTEKNTIITKLFKKVSHINYTTSLYLVLLCISLFLTSLFFLIQKPQKKEFFSNLIAISVFSLILSSVLFAYKVNTNNTLTGVVINKKASAHSGPSEKLPTLFYIHEGKTCIIKSSNPNWTEIKLSNGFIGWVPSNTLFLVN
jgi:tetratricopeptide (TPR) repeat protein